MSRDMVGYCEDDEGMEEDLQAGIGSFQLRDQGIWRGLRHYENSWIAESVDHLSSLHGTR